MLELLNMIQIPFLNISLYYFLSLATIFIISIGFHEFAHAWTSVKLGDPTPKIQGRYTLNPFAHIDPLGFIMIFLIHFGRGKPVEVNPYYYKNPLKGELITALAGPFSNIILAIIGIILYNLANIFNINHLIIQFFFLFSMINIALAIFNLLPVPPLDGYRIVKFLNPNLGSWIDQNLFILSILFLILLFTPGIGDMIKSIIINTSAVIFNILNIIVTILLSLIFSLFN